MRILTSVNRQSASVSFRVATTTSLAHNNRENTHGNPDIDPSRIKDNVTYIREDIEEVYKREFGEAVEEYNSKQKRSDRKINDYYKKILNDSKTHHQREIVVAVGKKDDNIDWEYKKNILEVYAQEFQEDNPNLIVYNSVLHMDEANPHLHINYIPVYEATRGLKKRVGHDKALEQQGNDDFTEWQREQRETLEGLMSSHDLKREYIGTHQYMTVAEYKELKVEIQELEQSKQSLDQEVNKRVQQLKILPDLSNEEIEIETKPNLFNKSEVIVKNDELEKIKALAEQSKAQSEKSKFYQKHAIQERDKATKLQAKNKELISENIDLEFIANSAEKRANKWEQKFKKLLSTVKEFVNKLEWLPSEIYNPFKKKMD